MDKHYMQRCIELAGLGLGYVAPNPLVGAVLVHDGKIIGEGYHQHFGEAHAEVNAIQQAIDKGFHDLLIESTLYVSLEPCSHFGKTPPCADLIIKYNIPKIYIGCVDTFSEVSGKGISRLKSAGVVVTVGVLEEECRAINKRFFTFHEKQRPYVILKWAQTQDGYIGKHSHPGLKISNSLTHTLAHRWRSEEQAILVGTNTALIDNPQLNVRHWQGNNPIRIVLDQFLRLPQYLHLFNNAVKTIVFNQHKTEMCENRYYQAVDFSKDLIPQVLQELYKFGIQSVIIEGGATLLNSFILLGLWDEARVFVSNGALVDGVKAPNIHQEPVNIDTLGDNRLLSYVQKN